MKSPIYGIIIAIFLVGENIMVIESRGPIDAFNNHPMIKADSDKSEDVHVLLKSEEEEEKLKNLVRVSLNPPQLSQPLSDIKKTLVIKGESEIKPKTEIQTWWADRFIETIKNWLYTLEIIMSNTLFSNHYEEHNKHYFDMWTTGRQDYPFQMTYQLKGNPRQKQTWNIIFYIMSIDGLGKAKINLKSMKISFEKSKQKLPDVNGNMVYRKDKICEFEMEFVVPTSRLRIRYEIIKSGEKSLYDPMKKEDKQEMKLGTLRLKVENINVTIRLSLTEIDKRFVTTNPTTNEKYYTLPPEIKDLRFSIEKLTRYNIEFQYHPIYSKNDPKQLAKNLNVGKAQKILTDFTDLLSSENDNKEICNRLKAGLVNRFSRAIMLAKDIFLIPDYVDEENSFYDPRIPFWWTTPADLELIKKIFYISYAYNNFFNTATHLMFSVNWLAVDEEKMFDVMMLFMEQQVILASKDLDVTDDGYDYDEDARMERLEQLIQGGMGKQEAEKIIQKEYQITMNKRKEERSNEAEKKLAEVTQQKKIAEEAEAEARRIEEERIKEEKERKAKENKKIEEGNEGQEKIAMERAEMERA